MTRILLSIIAFAVLMFFVRAVADPPVSYLLALIGGILIGCYLASPLLSDRVHTDG
jgi:hypothetical protein